MSDPWYDELKRVGRKYGLSDYEIDSMKGLYNRGLSPLDALIAAMHDAGLGSEWGEFGAGWDEDYLGL
jgi:hypothetical protein